MGTNVIAYVDGDREVAVPGSRATGTVQTVAVSFTSTPDGADVIIDGKYAASTPSALQLATGDHTASIEKSGFKAWQRTITVTVGSNITINATLERQ